jgi:hypothetical protein
VPVRRRWGRVAGGGLLMLVAGWVVATLYVTAGERVEVVVMARDVPRLAPIERDDLRTMRVAADPSLATVPGQEIGELVGRVPRTDLLEGTLLGRTELFPKDQRLVEPDEAVVFLTLPPGSAARDILREGANVRVAVLPRLDGESGEAQQVSGWILDPGDESEDARERRAAVVVPADEAGVVQAAAGDGRYGISAIGEGG